MRSFRNTVICVAFAAAMATSSWMSADAQVTKGEMETGGKLGYVSENSSASLTAFYRYSFSSHFRLSPEIGYTFRNNDKDAFTIDINAHMPLGIGSDRVAFYPLAGLNFSSWYKQFSSPEFGTSSKRSNRIGLNLGAGFELRCSSRIKVLIEAKYCLIKSYSSAQIAAGISYII